MNPKNDKITVVGAGTIGSLSAYLLMMRKSASKVTLVNRNSKKALVKAFDMSHCLPQIGGTNISGGSFDESAGSQVIIITVGTLPKKDGRRTDVLQNNVDIYKRLIPKLVELSPEAVILTVTNPVDIMALAASKYSGFPSNRILGSGTFLDSLRFRSFIAEAIGVSPKHIDAMILGEHGNSMVPIWSQAKINGIELESYVKDMGIKWSQEIKDDIMDKTRRAGWKIREGNEHSSYAIAFSAVLISEAILHESKDYLPTSFEQSDTYGAKDLFMSLPIQLGRNGYRDIAKLDYTYQEEKLLEKSVSILNQNINKIKF